MKENKGERPTLRPTLSRSSKILGLLNGNSQDNVQPKKLPEKIKKSSSIPSYVDLFDQGAWEELDSALRKQPLDENLKRKQPWGREYMEITKTILHPSHEVTYSHETNLQLDNLPIDEDIVVEVSASPYVDRGKVLFTSPSQPTSMSGSSLPLDNLSIDKDFDESFQLLENNKTKTILQPSHEVTYSHETNLQLDNLPIGENIVVEVSASPYVGRGKVLFTSPSQPTSISGSSLPLDNLSIDKDFDESFQLLENNCYPNEVISIINAAKGNEEKRKKRCDRQNCCIFCGLLLTNLTRHMKRKHSNEKDVARYMALLEEVPLESALERNTIMENLRLKGNHEYNISLLNKATPNQSINEQLLPSKRPPANKTKNNTDYIFCNLCLGLFMRKSFYRHAAVCVKKEKKSDKVSGKDLEDQSDLNLTNTSYIKKYGHNCASSTKETLPLMMEKIIPMLRKDHCGLVALNDNLIVSICNDYLLSHRDVKDHTLVTRKMRDGSKLLMAICKIEPSINRLEDIYDSCHVNTVMRAVEEVSVCTDDGEVGIIGMPPRLMWVLSEGARKLVDQVLTSPNKSEIQKKYRREQIHQFMEVVRGRWKYSIGTNAEKSRKRKKMVKEKIMPTVNDLKIFSKTLRNHLEKSYKNLLNTQSVVNYEQLCKVMIALIITINARRPLEAAKIGIDFFLNRTKTNTTDEELLSLLDENERKAFNSLSLFTVPGKREQDASILLTKEMEQGIELIVQCREELGVSPDCKYLFARPKFENAFDGSAVMREMRSLCTLERPEFMTSTGLRHLVATRSLAKGKDFTTHVSKFMSHTLDIHNKNYAFPLDVINKGKVGHFLLELQGLDEVDCVQNNENPKSQLSNKELLISNTNLIQHEKTLVAQSFNEMSGLSNNVLINNNFDEDSSFDPEMNLSSSDNEETPIKKRKSIDFKRIPWTDKEKEVVLGHFLDCIKTGKNPGTIRCRELINKEPILNIRTANQINTLIDNYNRGKTKLPPCFAYIRSNVSAQ